MNLSTLNYRLIFHIKKDDSFIITFKSADDDEAIRIAHVAADVLLIQNRYKFSIVIEQQGRAVATMCEDHSDEDSLERPVNYHPVYIPGTKLEI